MSILFRYILREFNKMFFMCFSAIMTVWLVIDFFEKLRGFLRHDAELRMMLEYFLLRMPFVAVQAAPFAILMATILTLGILGRSHEITAMRSCGISLYRIAMPFFIFAVAAALALLSLSTVIVPITNSKADYIRKTRIEKRTAAAMLSSEHPWIRIRNQTLLSIDVVDPEQNAFHNVRLYQLGPRFELMDVTEAHELRYGQSGWALSDGVQRALLPDGTVVVTPFALRPIDVPLTPEDFRRSLSRDPEEMMLADLQTYIARLIRDGYNAARPLTDYHSRLASPFVALVMVLVGIAVSQRRTGVRGSGMAIGIGLAIVIGLLYWFTNSVAVAIGHTGKLMPVLAGWMANLLFMSFGLYLFLTVRH